jgi:hypothetical protein
LLAASASAAGITPFKFDASKLDMYGTRDPQLMALSSLAEGL